MEVVMAVTLLTLRIHGVLPVVKLGSQLWVSENLFSLSDVYELLFSLLLFLWILEVVWMPLLCQFPVGFDNLLFLGSSVTIGRVSSAHL